MERILAFHKSALKTRAKAFPNWLDLPRDITRNILQRLSTIEILTSACEVCAMWSSICMEPLMWHTISMINLRCLPYDHEKMETICYEAIDRSCRHLKNLSIEAFCTDDLLQYIAENARNLQRLRLVSCRLITDEGFGKAVRKFPQLEDVDISFCSLEKDSLEVLGRSCPLLKSLKFVKSGMEYIEYGGNDEAVVIAKTMPGLRRLIMVSNDLDETGMVKILNGCPLLESLEFELCSGLSNLDLRLWRRVKHIEKVSILNSSDELDDYYDCYENSYENFLVRWSKWKIPEEFC